MKILIITPHIFAGGAEKAILNLVYRLSNLGCRVSIATLSLDLSKLPSDFSKLNYVLPKKPLNQPQINDLKTVFTTTVNETTSFVLLIKNISKKYDVVCACNFPAYWSTYFSNLKPPLVWLSSEVLGPYNQTKDVYDKNGFFRLALRFASVIDKFVVNTGFDYIVTCSDFNSRLIKHRYGRDSIVLNTGVDYNYFNSYVPNAKFKLGVDGHPLLLHVGALIQRKNQILSIEALKILKKHLPHAKLVLVGDGSWKTILKAKVNSLGLQKDVYFMANVSEEELRCIYHACDINLFPVKDQTWGLVPFEALAAGKPSVVSKGCGAAEVIAKEKIGFLIKPQAEQLAKAVLHLLEKPELAQDIVKRGQKFVSCNLTWDNYAQNMYKVLQTITTKYIKA